MNTSPAETDIRKYEAQAGAMRRWIDGLSPADLDAHPVPGTWSMRELVHHMVDSDLVYGHRMRKIAAEKKPLLMGYDETLFAASPAHQAGDVDNAALLFEANRKWIAAFLRALPADAWQREGVHSERGIVTIPKLMQTMIEHVPHHEKFAVAKRNALRKPMRELAGAGR